MCINEVKDSMNRRSRHSSTQARVATLTVSFAAAICLLQTAPQALGHHSAAMFDDQVELTLSGTVTRFDYVNPHSWLYVEVENDDGTMTEWGFELDAPPRLRRLGISPNFWQGGDRVTVKTNPLKDGRPAGHLVGAITLEGRTFGNASGITAPD
jgi:hypothetical protein